MQNVGKSIMEYVSLIWVAEDGSTYWGHTSREPMDDSGWPFYNMDAWYATRWSKDNLARSAYDGRLATAGGSGHESDADSPAVDAGSKDWLNGGTTNTYSFSFEDIPVPINADNTPPHYLGYFDNQHWDPATTAPLSWEDSNAITCGTRDDLDIGYHYWGACYKTNDEFTPYPSLTASAVTLRHPKEAAGDIHYTINSNDVIFHPGIPVMPDGAKTVAIASSAYGQNHIEKTISCFVSNMYEYLQTYTNHSLVIFRRFRGDSDAYGVVDHYWVSEGGRPHINRLAMTTGSGATNGNMNEPIYLGVLVTKGNWEEYLSQLEIHVYRYEPNPEHWVEIGNKIILWDISTKRQIYDVALAANGNDLWVFWLYHYLDEYDNDIWDFRGHYIYNAAGRTVTDTISGNSAFYSPNIQLGEVINADWDDAIIGPRLIWTQKDGDYYKTHAGRVTLYNNQPNNMDHIYQISNNNSSNATNPSIAVNNSQYNEFCAFAGFTFGENSSTIGCKLIDGDDVWQQLENYYNVTPDDSYITYRYFGNPQFTWLESETIKTKDETVAEGNHYHECLQLKTNRYNKTDVYTSYGEDQYIIIQELHP